MATTTGAASARYVELVVRNIFISPESIGKVVGECKGSK
jgi:hypothetical protein